MPRFKYAICNEIFGDWPFEKAFAFAAKCGYTGIEIAPFTMAMYADKISAARRAEVRRQAKHAGLEVVGLHWLLAKTEGFHLTSPDAAVRRKTAAYLGELARLCADLGGRIMVLGSPQQRNLAPGMSKQQGMKYAAEVLHAAAPTLEKTGVVIGLEPLATTETNFLTTAAEGASWSSWSIRPPAACISTARRWPEKRGQSNFPERPAECFANGLSPFPDPRAHPQVPQAVHPFPRQRSEPSRPRLRQARFRADHEGARRNQLSRLGLGRAHRLLGRRRAARAGEHRVSAEMRQGQDDDPQNSVGFRLAARPIRRLGEQIGNASRKPGQHFAAVEGFAFAEHRVLRRADVHPDFAPRSVVDEPDQPHAGGEIILELAVHLPASVAPADDFHGQVGGQVGNRLAAAFAARVGGSGK